MNGKRTIPPEEWFSSFKDKNFYTHLMKCLQYTFNLIKSEHLGRSTLPEWAVYTAKVALISNFKPG
jgi:hypothetical protein